MNIFGEEYTLNNKYEQMHGVMLQKMKSLLVRYNMEETLI